MDPEILRDIGIKSCQDMYEQMTVMQKGNNPRDSKLVSTIVNDVKSIERRPDYLKISLKNKVRSLDGLGLHIENEGDFDEKHVYFDEYDEESLSISAFPTEQLMEIINNHDTEDIKLITDMKWLISITEAFFENNGLCLGYPEFQPHFTESDYQFPQGQSPTEEQKKAVDTILNSRLSYIWGAPGTGKTQYVLSTCILAYIKKGGRVAVIAPTNNSVEQVLRGVMKVIESDDPSHKYIVPERDILRLGSATSEFIRDFKEICEDRAIMQRIKRLQDTVDIIKNVIYERRIELLKAYIDEIKNQYIEYDLADDIHKRAITKNVLDMWELIQAVVMEDPNLSSIVERIDEYNLRQNIETVATRIMTRRRSVLDIEKYMDMDVKQLQEIIELKQQEIEELEPRDTEYRSKRVKIMAMTPYVLMSRPSLMEPGGIIDVSHIFIDEVGYSNLIQTMPVFMCGRPVAMLGDHMQLPPVCEIDRDDIIEWSTQTNDYCRDGYMRYSFMWDQSALYSESYIFGTIDEALMDYIEERDPRFRLTGRANLTESHRFADNMAKILDKAVYKNGIKGHQGEALQVICLDAVGTNADTRANPEEATIIRDYIRGIPKDENYVILTPYKDQRKKIIEVCGNEISDRVITIHGSQGREWDTVIVSISDNRNSSREVPFRFTSLVPPNDGKKVMNTAMSRAKKKLVLVCDYDFWKDRANLGDLIGLLLEDENTIILRGLYGSDGVFLRCWHIFS